MKLFFLCVSWASIVNSKSLRNVPCLISPPPGARMALGGESGLQKDCDLFCQENSCDSIWQRDSTEGYEIASSIFTNIADISWKERESRKRILWFPSLGGKDVDSVKGIAEIVTRNSDRLGGVTAVASSWPEVPATMIELSYSEISSFSNYVDDSESGIASAVAATEKWVDETLCRLNLCPYTSSLLRAAVGLETASVKEGPVIVRHASESREEVCGAAALAAAFWDGIAEMKTDPEEKVATLLIVAPSLYDSEFVEFSTACDELLQPVVRLTGAEDIVGRAWFHPLYQASEIGHDTILPGHALPASMVEGFVDRHIRSEEVDLDGHKLDSSSIATANDAVRWTPHATINLLRRSQLNAAKDVEAASRNKKPNAIYARNVVRLIRDGITKQG